MSSGVFEYMQVVTVGAQLEVDDIGECAILARDDIGQEYYLLITTRMGQTEVIEYGPCMPDISLLPQISVFFGVSIDELFEFTEESQYERIENMLNEAAILAAREDRKIITMHDISEAINKVIAGPAKKSRVITETDKRITAYHESGHAIVAKMVKNCDNVHEVSIIPRGQAAGYTITLPVNDDNHMTKQKLLDNITMLLAGRAAEEIVIKDISTGASNDIQRASKIARKMVTEWGMSEDIGTMYLGASEEVFLGRDYQTQLNYSDEVAAKIDEEVKRILDEQYEKALTILKENRRVMDDMVKVLYEKETIFEEEIDRLFDDPTTPEIELPVNPKKDKDEE